MKEIKIKYFSTDYPRLEKIVKGDYIDLRVNGIGPVVSITDGLLDEIDIECINDRFSDDGLEYYKGDVIKFKLGVAMELPDGYEAILVPRSSTFKHWGLIQTNSQGIIDNSYSGDKDEWLVEFIATRDGYINRFDRICQFRIQENQPEINFKEVDKLEGKNRGGYGSTGKN